MPVVHFEVIGTDPGRLRGYYGALFGWRFDTSPPVASAVSDAGEYGFVDSRENADGAGINGGVGGVPLTRRTSCSTSASRTWMPPSGRPSASAARG